MIRKMVIKLSTIPNVSVSLRCIQNFIISAFYFWFSILPFNLKFLIFFVYGQNEKKEVWIMNGVGYLLIVNF